MSDTAQDVKPLDPVPSESPNPEEPIPYWMTRKYVGRAFWFRWNGLEIEGSFFNVGNNNVDCDGLCSGQEYKTLNELFDIVKVDEEQRKQLLAKIQNFANFR